MKDALPKFLITLGSIGLALLLVGFLYFAWNSSKDQGNQMVSKSLDTTNSMLESNITQYNRDDISGSEVINAISTFAESSDEIYIEVKTSRSDVTYIYPSKKIEESGRSSNNEVQDALKLARQKGNKNYISPKGRFSGKIIYMSSDDSVIEGILFEQTK